MRSETGIFTHMRTLSHRCIYSQMHTLTQMRSQTGNSTVCAAMCFRHICSVCQTCKHAVCVRYVCIYLACFVCWFCIYIKCFFTSCISIGSANVFILMSLTSNVFFLKCVCSCLSLLPPQVAVNFDGSSLVGVCENGSVWRWDEEKKARTRTRKKGGKHSDMKDVQDGDSDSGDDGSGLYMQKINSGLSLSFFIIFLLYFYHLFIFFYRFLIFFFSFNSDTHRLVVSSNSVVHVHIRLRTCGHCGILPI